MANQKLRETKSEKSESKEWKTEREEGESMASITVVAAAATVAAVKALEKWRMLLRAFHLYAAMIRRTSVTMGYSYIWVYIVEC